MSLLISRGLCIEGTLLGLVWGVHLMYLVCELESADVEASYATFGTCCTLVDRTMLSQVFCSFVNHYVV